MAWKKPADGLAALHEQLVEIYPSVKKQMFGFPVRFVNDNMFTGIFEDGVFMRLSSEDKAEILCENDEISPFTPLGRTMKEYVFIPANVFEQQDFRDKWLEKSYAFVSSLLPKVKKEKQQKKD